MATCTERLEFDFHPDKPNYIVDHEVTVEDWQLFSDEMYERFVDRDYWCNYFGEWLEDRHADHYRAEAAQKWMELAS